MPMFRFCVVVLACAASGAALAKDAESRPGDHPAVVVKRLEATRGYDYASKFYPHPAWLYMSTQPPDDAARMAAARAPQETTGQARWRVSPSTATIQEQP